MNVRFHPLAAEELYEAADYYEHQVRGLGDAFIDEVEHAVALIRQHPEASPVLLPPLRRKILLRFPFSILYTFNSNSILILAIANQKRRPFYWSGRS